MNARYRFLAALLVVVLMAWVSPTTTVWAELAGVGAGWTDISADLTNDVIVQDYGIKDRKPNNRCAPTGLIKFGMRNDAGCSGSVAGYYSLDGASKRSGWGIDIRIRVKQIYGGDTRYLIGRLTAVQVDPGIYESNTVQCIAVDYMDTLARTNAPTSLQLNKRLDEVFSAMLANVATQPENTDIQPSDTTAAFALDNVQSNTKCLTVAADLARSELGYIYSRRDATDGQTLAFERRNTRQGSPAALIHLDNTMHALDLPGDRGDVLNRFLLTVNPRVTSGYENIVVASMASPFVTGIGPGQTQIIFLDYTDPAQPDRKIGATNVVTTLVATTDYTATFSSGSDATASMSVVATAFASTVKLEVTNDHATLAIYPQTLSVRGDGVLSLNPYDVEAIDQTSVDTYGENLVQMNMLHQSDGNFVTQVGEYLLYLFKDRQANVSKVSFYANQSAALLTAGLTGDISSVVQITETRSGLASKYYWINGVTLETTEFEELIVTWYLTPADRTAYWSLGSPGSQLGVDTIPGFL